MKYYVGNKVDDFEVVNRAIKLFEAEEEVDQNVDAPVDEEPPAPTNIEIAPPPEESNVKNSDTFTDGKIDNSFMQNDAAIQSLIKLITADMQEQDAIKPYVDAFFTKIGLNDVDPEQFKLLSSDIWTKLEGLSNLDPVASLADFNSWSKSKIDQINRQ